MWSRNKANLYIRDALDDFHYDPKALPSPIAQRKIYRNKLMLTHLTGFGGGVSGATGTSYAFDGNGDMLDCGDSADWNMGTGLFTIDFWARFNSSGTQQFFGQYVDGNNFWRSEVQPNANLITFSIDDPTNPVGFAPAGLSATTEVWYHFAYIRGWASNADSWAITQDGVIIGSPTTDADGFQDLASSFFIGNFRSAGASQFFSGNMDEFRVSKGVARWTANFTPSTVAYTSDGNTQLLIHCNETLASGTTGSGATFTDSGNTGHTVTENGNAIRDTSIFKIPTI